MKSRFLANYIALHAFLSLFTTSAIAGGVEDISTVTPANSGSVFRSILEELEKIGESKEAIQAHKNYWFQKGRWTGSLDFSGHCYVVKLPEFKEYLRKLQGKIERSRGTSRGGGGSAARAEQERKAREEAERKAREAERQRQEQERLRWEAAERAERERRARQEAERRAREAEEARQKQMALNNLRQNWLSDGSLKSQYLIELLKSLRFSPNGGYATFQNMKSKVENTVQNILKGYSQKLRIIVGTPLYRLSGKFGEICTGRDLLSVEGVSMPKHIAQILDVPSALLQDTETLKVIQSECNQAIKTIDMELYNTATAKIPLELKKLFDLWGELKEKQDKDNLSEDEQKEFFEVINRSHLEFKLKFGNISSSNINTTLPIFFSLMLANLQKENAGLVTQIAQKKGTGKAQNQAQRILKTLQKQVNFGNIGSGFTITNEWENLQKTFSCHPALAIAGINGAALGNITREQMISAINLVVSDSMLDSLPTPNLVESILNPGYEYTQKDKIFDSPQHDELNRYISELIANKGTKLATMLRATMSGKAHAVYDRAGQEDEATARTLYALREQISDILQENLIPMGFGLPKIIEWEGDFLLVQELQQLYDVVVNRINRSLESTAKGLLPFVVCNNIARNNIIIKNCVKSDDLVEILRKLYEKGTLAFNDYVSALPENLSAEDDAKEFCELAKKAIDIMWGKEPCADWDQVARLAKILGKGNKVPDYNIKTHMKHYVRHWDEWKTLKEKASLLETNDGDQFVQAVENIANAQGLSIPEIQQRYDNLLIQLAVCEENGSFIKSLLRNRELLTGKAQNLEMNLSPMESTIFQQLKSTNDISKQALDKYMQADNTYRAVKELQEVLLKIIEDCKMRNLDGSFKTAVYGNKYYTYFPNAKKAPQTNMLQNKGFQQQLMQKISAKNPGLQGTGTQSSTTGGKKNDNVEINQELKNKYEQLSANLPQNLLSHFENVLKDKEPRISAHASSDGISVEEFKRSVGGIDIVTACFPTLPTLVSTKQTIADIEKNLSTVFNNKIDVPALTGKLNDFKTLVESTLDSFNNDNLLDVVYTNVLPKLRPTVAAENKLKLELVGYLSSPNGDSSFIDEALKGFEKLNEKDQKICDSFNMDEVRAHYAENICQVLNKILEVQKYQWKPIIYTDQNVKGKIVQFLKGLKEKGRKEVQPDIEIKENDFSLMDTVLSIPKVKEFYQKSRKTVLELRPAMTQAEKDCLNALNKMLVDEKIDKMQIIGKISPLNLEQIQSISAMVYGATASVRKYNEQINTIIKSLPLVLGIKNTSGEDTIAMDFIVNNARINIDLPVISKEISQKIAAYEALRKVINKRNEVCRAVQVLKKIVSDVKSNKVTTSADVGIKSQSSLDNLIAAITVSLRIPSSANILSVFEAMKTELKLKSDILGLSILKEYNDNFSISKILEAPGSYLPKVRINTGQGQRIKRSLLQSTEVLIKGINEGKPIKSNGVPPPPPPPPPAPKPKK